MLNYSKILDDPKNLVGGHNCQSKLEVLSKFNIYKSRPRSKSRGLFEYVLGGAGDSLGLFENALGDFGDSSSSRRARVAATDHRKRDESQSDGNHSETPR
jgi:hypothetical protein